MSTMRFAHPNRLRQPRSGRRSRQAGMSLIEVMVSVLIMGIGLLGIAALQTTALRNGQSSLERSQAVIQTYTILDAMRANRQAALAGSYNTGGWECAAPTGGSLAVTDRAAWVGSLKATMGRAGDTTTCGNINCANGVCSVQVRWDDSHAVGNGGNGSSTRQAETRVLL